MKRIILLLLTSIILLVLGYSNLFITSLKAQPFINEIKAFKKQDSIYKPATKAILFIGSSSFRMWKDYANYFPGYPIINRGFGGSALPDVIMYANDILFPYQPKQIIIYCGENDFADSDTVTVTMVVERFKTLFELIRAKMPKMPIAYISMKPSPSRWTIKDKMITANQLIQHWLSKKKRTDFIDVWAPMLGANGLPMQDLFLGDNLHMTAKGYAIWQQQIQPYLLNN